MNYRQSVRVFLAAVVQLVVFGAAGVGGLHGAYGEAALPSWVYYLAGFLIVGVGLAGLYRINRSYLRCDNCGAQTLPLRWNDLESGLKALLVLSDTSGARFPEACPRCGASRAGEDERRTRGWIGRLLSAHWRLFNAMVGILALVNVGLLLVLLAFFGLVP